MTQSRHLLRLNQARLRRLKVAIGGLGGVARIYANGNAVKPAARAFTDFLAEDFRAIPP